MAVSTDEYQALLARLTKLERSFNDLVVALDRCVSNEQVNNLYLVLQQEMAAISNTVTTLEDRVENLEDEPYDETG